MNSTDLAPISCSLYNASSSAPSGWVLDSFHCATLNYDSLGRLIIEIRGESGSKDHEAAFYPS